MLSTRLIARVPCITSQFCAPGPSFATILKNTFGVPIRFFITGEGEKPSMEGTTQDDPLTMTVYALAATPLICSSRQKFLRCGMLMMPLSWEACPSFTLVETSFDLWPFPNAAKTFLIVKRDQLDSAQTLFKGTNIQISCEGQHHLGGAIGIRVFTDARKVQMQS